VGLEPAGATMWALNTATVPAPLVALMLLHLPVMMMPTSAEIQRPHQSPGPPAWDVHRAELDGHKLTPLWVTASKQVRYVRNPPLLHTQPCLALHVLCTAKEPTSCLHCNRCKATSVFQEQCSMPKSRKRFEYLRRGTAHLWTDHRM
jgi:hypothetical protein